MGVSARSLSFVLHFSTLAVIFVFLSVADAEDALGVGAYSQSLSNEQNLGAMSTRQSAAWVVQLGSGNGHILSKESERLRRSWPDARVVVLQGRPALVVGSWASASEATFVLRELRKINESAFIHQLPENVLLFDASKLAIVKPQASVQTNRLVDAYLGGAWSIALIEGSKSDMCSRYESTKKSWPDLNLYMLSEYSFALITGSFSTSNSTISTIEAIKSSYPSARGIRTYPSHVASCGDSKRSADNLLALTEARQESSGFVLSQQIDELKANKQDASVVESVTALALTPIEQELKQQAKLEQQVSHVVVRRGDLLDVEEKSLGYLAHEVNMNASQKQDKQENASSLKSHTTVSVLRADDVFDKTTNGLNATGKSKLLQICSSLVQRPQKLEVLGYTDNREHYLGANLALSRTWAKNVSNFLTENRCFSGADMVFNGLGSARAIESNANESGRAANRRVEIIFHNVEK